MFLEQGAGTAPQDPGGNAVKAPGEAPVASDSGATHVGINTGTSKQSCNMVVGLEF